MSLAPSRPVYLRKLNFLMRSPAGATALLVFLAAVARSQQPVTREQAIDAAVTRGARAAVARADTLVGAAQLLTARSWDNPSLAASYSKAPPNYHAIVDLPLDITGARGTRIRAAQASRLASQYRFAFERAVAALDADPGPRWAGAGETLEEKREGRRQPSPHGRDPP